MMKNIFRVASIAVRELVYERVFYILLAFALFALGMSLLLGQLTYVNQTKLTLDFMLGGTHISMVLFAVFMGTGLFKKELTMGSVSMILSKPISRTTFVLGKYFGQITVQGGVIYGMTLMTILLCSMSGKISPLSVLQAGTLIFFEVALITAVTYLAAVNAGVITTALFAFAFFILGHLRTPITGNVNYRDDGNVAWTVTQALVPNLEVFNMKMLTSYGLTIGIGEFFWALLYGVVCTAFFLSLAAASFSRKDILT